MAITEYGVPRLRHLLLNDDIYCHARTVILIAFAAYFAAAADFRRRRYASCRCYFHDDAADVAIFSRHYAYAGARRADAFAADHFFADDAMMLPPPLPLIFCRYFSFNIHAMPCFSFFADASLIFAPCHAFAFFSRAAGRSEVWQCEVCSECAGLLLLMLSRAYAPCFRHAYICFATLLLSPRYVFSCFLPPTFPYFHILCRHFLHAFARHLSRQHAGCCAQHVTRERQRMREARCLHAARDSGHTCVAGGARRRVHEAVQIERVKGAARCVE